MPAWARGPASRRRGKPHGWRRTAGDMVGISSSLVRGAGCGGHDRSSALASTCRPRRPPSGPTRRRRRRLHPAPAPTPAQTQTTAQPRKPAKVARRPKHERSSDRAGTDLAERLNKNTLVIISGGLQSTDLAITHQLSDVLDDGDDLRILPMVGAGGSRNIRDVRFMKGIDLGITQTNLLARLRQSGEIGPLDDKIVYLAKLFNEELHIVVRADSGLASIEQLKGRTVSLGEPGSGTPADRARRARSPRHRGARGQHGRRRRDRAHGHGRDRRGRADRRQADPGGGAAQRAAPPRGAVRQAAARRLPAGVAHRARTIRAWSSPAAASTRSRWARC